MNEYIFKATCTNVVDGDTIDCTIDVGFKMTTKQRLRLHGINAAEMHAKDPEERALAKQAKDFLLDLLLNEQVYIQTYKSDSFGRYLAKVMLPVADKPGEFYLVNDTLLDLKLARPFMTDSQLIN